jgi:hypothetical protein
LESFFIAETPLNIVKEKEQQGNGRICLAAQEIAFRQAKQD